MEQLSALCSRRRSRFTLGRCLSGNEAAHGDRVLDEAQSLRKLVSS